MSEYMDRAKALRGDKEHHYNCCQATLIPFCDRCGIDAETAEKVAAHFVAGMRHGGTCGAVTGALMALGLAGKDSDELLKRFRERNGCLDCAHLLMKAKENGEEKKPHCDRMVYDTVEMVEEILGE